MGRVLAVHEIELRPGIQDEEFERFMREKFLPLPIFPGWRARLLKGERGERAGKYAILLEIESLEARDRFSPGEGRLSAEARAFQDRQPASYALTWEELDRYATTQLGATTVYTDYVELAGDP